MREQENYVYFHWNIENGMNTLWVLIQATAKGKTPQ